ncbi:GNAT family N-acetyltransferase [Alloscardovia macacae]|uniref:GNAT family N-acetyltransferase n=1 Tax=Alloscardovia macacae TaxID=1160091 RepID=A0A1Y2SZK0_9BIFI|nr:GNAT family N-acetyltransferase [Alloscardovia macacae]OTA26720.1 GNAT family N-acetyltransferase [Alloscardovia macacae]OTA29586.1 GNAT family N-acetyltransferase [Alloscardovia macacae]
MTASLTIRRAQAADIPALLELLRQVNSVHADGRPDLFNRVTKYSEAQLRERLTASDDDPVFVAVRADDPSVVYGHCFCITQDRTGDALFRDIRTLYVDDVCVDSAARGMGVGRVLLEYVQSWARERGYYNLTLGVWECNPGARAFYEKLGMKPQETVMETILQ